MSSEDEVRRLREDLDKVMDSVKEIARRLDEFEGRRKQPTPFVKPPPTAEAPPVTPPPLRVAAISEQQTPAAPEPPRPERTVPPPDVPLYYHAEQARKTEVDAVPTLFEEPLSFWLRRLGPKEEMSWEMALGTYWLPRIGMLIVAVGMVFGATLAIQYFKNAWWLPHARVAAGYVLCAVFLVAGKKLEHRAQNYARVLLAGGMALTYFVTFSTYYVGYTKIVSHSAPTLIALAAIVGVWYLIAQVRGSRLVAAGATLLGHLTVFISTWTVPHALPSSEVGLLVLSVGSAAFLLRNRWYHVAALGMVGSYLNHALWMARSPGSYRFVDFCGAMSILCCYFLIFAIAEALAPEGLRRRAIRPSFRNAYVSFNSAATFGLGILIMRHYTFTQDRLWAFYFTLAAIFLCFGEYYQRRLKNDQVYNVYFVKACAVATLGLADYFDGATLTLSLALQAVTLLASARRSGLVVTRVLSWAVAAVAFLHGAYMIEQGAVAYADPEYWRALIPSALTAAAFLALASLYERTDWTTRSLRCASVPEEWRWPLWEYGLLAEPPAPGLESPPSRLLFFPRAFALGGVLLALGFAFQMTVFSDMAPALCVAALAAFSIGVVFSVRSAVEASGLLAAAGACVWIYFTVQVHKWAEPVPVGLRAMLFPFMLLVPHYAMAEIARLRETSGVFCWSLVPLFAHREERLNAFSVAIGALLAAVAVCTAWCFCPLGWQTFAVALAAFAAAGYATALSAPAIGLTSIALAAGGSAMGIYDFYHGECWGIMAAVTALLGGAALAVERRYLGARPGLYFHREAPVPFLLYPAALLPMAVHFARHFEAPYYTLALALAGVAAGLLVLALTPRALAACAVGLMVWAAACWALYRPDWNVQTWHAAALLLAGTALAGDRFFCFRALFPRKVPQTYLVCLTWFVLLFQGKHLDPRHWEYLDFAVISFGFLTYAGVFREPIPAAAALLAAAIATVTLLYDSYLGRIPVTSAVVAGYIALVLFWGTSERACAPLLRRTDTRGDMLRPAARLFVAVSSTLLIVMLERIPALSEYYLTISWTAAAVLLMAVAFPTRQKYYRYAGLCAFAAAVIRVALWDTRELHGFHRIAAWIVLGLVLLAVSYGYVQARQYLRRISTPAGAADPPSESAAAE